MGLSISSTNNTNSVHLLVRLILYSVELSSTNGRMHTKWGHCQWEERCTSKISVPLDLTTIAITDGPFRPTNCEILQ